MAGQLDDVLLHKVMMIYHKECRIVVPHNPKCGGIAVQNYFMKFQKGWKSWDYTRICDVERRFGVDLSDWLVVAQIRNPYERAVSYYEHCHNGMGCRDKWRRRAPKMTFAEFLRDPMNEWPGWYEANTCKKYYPNQPADVESYLRQESVFRYWYVWDAATGALHPNLAVVRLEYLNQDWSNILDEDVRIPKFHANPKRKSVDCYFTPELCELVEARHAWAFRHYYSKERPLCHAA